MPEFAMINSPNIALMSDPVASTMTRRTPSIALMRVKTFALIIDQVERPDRSGSVLPLPSR